MADQDAIFLPFFGMMLLTVVVWCYMYFRRLNYIIANRIRPQELRSPEHVSELIPEAVQYPANNLRNLLELPIIFYALCLYLYVSQSVDAIYVGAAWAYLGLRILHSANQCTVNRVKYRFYVYVASSLVLWYMVGRAAIGVFAG